MQTQQMAAMAGMNANVGGPVEGTPIMGNMPRPGGRPQDNPVFDPREKLNTYIYDYFLRNNHARLARLMLECELKMQLKPGTKASPGGRNVNGIDPMDADAREGLPEPQLPEGQLADNSFLLDWWGQFWDIYNAARKKQSGEKGTQYITHTRNLTQMHNEHRNQRMMMASNAMNPQYQNMMRSMPNGGANPNDLKRAAAMNNRNPNGNPMANMQMKNQAMLSAQMQRDGSGMNMDGQRPQSPGSSENAPSPNKRPRVEGGMNQGNMPANQFNEFAQGQNVQQKSIEVYAQSLAQQQRTALNNHAMAQGMNTGVQGSPMNHQGLDGQENMFAGNQPRPGIPAAPGQPQGNHALQDYQMQLMLLEQQNKKRLLMARQEQDSMSGGPHAQPGVSAPGFPPSMSPSGSRAGPSPNPVDQMKRTPKMNQPGLPGSPMPPDQRGSPAPNMGAFDVTQMPPGMPPQFYNPQMQQQMAQQNPMMRPPSSHPFPNGQQLTQQQMEAMRQGAVMQNGAWRGGPPGMMQQGQQMGPMGGNPQPRNQMPPPPAPAGEQPRAQDQSPAQPPAPPTPNQSNKANPKKKVTKNDKKQPKPKGSGATPAASTGDEPPTPTPSTPVTANHNKNFQNGQQQPSQPPAHAQNGAPQQQTGMDGPPFGLGNEEPFDLNLGFGEGDALESFDFDSFLHVGDDNNGFNSITDFGFGDTAEVGGEL